MAPQAAPISDVNGFAEPGSQGCGLTFRNAAEAALAQASPAWTTHDAQAHWTLAIERYAQPFSGMSIDAVTAADVAAALAPIWRARPSMAAKVRRIWERVFEAGLQQRATVVGGAWAKCKNPARWGPELRVLLNGPEARRSRPREHEDLTVMMEQLRMRRGAAAGALEFAVLTCSSLDRVCRLTWSGIDRQNRLWLSGGEPNGEGGWRPLDTLDVPLSDDAIAILDRVPDAGAATSDSAVFRGRSGLSLTEAGRRRLRSSLGETVFQRLTGRALHAAFQAWMMDAAITAPQDENEGRALFSEWAKFLRDRSGQP